MTAFSKIPKKLIRIFTGTTLLSALSLLYTGCEDTSPVPVEQHGFIQVELDSLWVLGSERYHRIVVRAFPIGWANGREMRCQIQGEGIATHFLLYDDGNHTVRHDSQGFADTLSGDAIGGDGQYTRLVNEKFTGRAGTYNLLFAFSGNPVTDDTLRSSIRIIANSPPVIVSFAAPDSIPSGRAQFQTPATAVILDPDGQGDIASASIKAIYVEDDFEIQFYTAEMSKANDTTWSFRMPASIAAGVATGTYQLRTFVSDWILSQRPENAVRGDFSPIWLENLPPRITGVTGPDTVYVTVNEKTHFHYNVKTQDDQSALDLEYVHLSISRYDSTTGRDTVNARHELLDNGLDTDTLAGDGVFTTIEFFAHRGNLLNTPFYFDWNAVDKVGQSSDTTRTTMVIVLVGNGVQGQSVAERSSGQDQPMERSQNVIDVFR